VLTINDGHIRLIDFGCAVERKYMQPLKKINEFDFKQKDNKSIMFPSIMLNDDEEGIPMNTAEILRKRQEIINKRKNSQPQEQQFRGTPMYAAPEIFNKEEVTDRLSIWYLFHSRAIIFILFL
jgi:serine/threonine protein kinase